MQNLPVQPNLRDIAKANTGRTTFQRLFETWASRFHDFGRSQLTKKDYSQISILNVRQMLVRVLLRVDLANLETSWDEFDDEFAQAALMTEALFGQDIRDSGLPTTPKAILLKALHFMARKCRKPILRRKMISLLGDQFQQFDFKPTQARHNASHTQIIDAIVSLEESAWLDVEGGQDGDGVCKTGCIAGEFRCNLHRVAEVHTDIKSQMRIKITLRSVGDVLSNRSGQIQHVSASIWS